MASENRTDAAADARPPWVLPGEPAPVRFMNTIWADRAGVYDALASRADLRAWLRDTGLSDRPVSAGDLREARGLRDALRRLAALVTDDPRTTAATGMSSAAAVEVVNRTMLAAPVAEELLLTTAGLTRRAWVSAPQVTSALATVAREGVTLLTDPARALRACLAPGCVLYFVHDHPRREWCGAACGNRARVARHYERTRSRAVPPGSAG